MARGQGGGSASAALAVVTVLALLQSALAVNYPINGDGVWDFGKNYQVWADGVKFVVGDTLEFKYAAGKHSVFQLAQPAFGSCDISTPQQQWLSGDDTVPLNAAGLAYFVCGIPNHCGAGMKFSVNVAAATPPTTPPTTPPATPPATPPTTPPTPTTPGSAPPPTTPASPPSTPTPGKAPAKAPSSTPTAKAPTAPAPPPGSSAGSVKAGLVTVAGAVVLAMLV